MSFKPSAMSHNPGCPCLGCGPYGFAFIKDFKARRADPSGANQGYSTGETTPMRPRAEANKRRDDGLPFGVQALMLGAVIIAAEVTLRVQYGRWPLLGFGLLRE